MCEVKEKKLYKGEVLYFVQFGGRIKIYYTRAKSLDQAKLFIAHRFNEDYGFTEDHIVIMRVSLAKEQKNKRS